MKRFVLWLRQPIPVNWATALYGFLQGSVLSFIAAFLLKDIRPFEPPPLLSSAVITTACVAVFTMPFWGLVMFKRHKTLASIGIATSLGALFLGVLFPALGVW